MAACLSAAPVSAERMPAKGTLDPRIRTAIYNPDEVYRLYGAVGYLIELIFADDEVFTGRAGGDLDALAIDGYANQVQIKPKAPVVATNLVIYTNRRAYRFEYSASNRPVDRFSSDAMYAVRFVYPPEPLKTEAADTQVRVDAELARAGSVRPRNLDYWYCGRTALKPIAVSDDGVHTRLTFSARSELPAIFVRNDDGSESLLNFSMEEGDVVIHRVARQFILRRGRVTGCIVNKGFIGTGARLPSGTVSPEVQRERKEAQ